MEDSSISKCTFAVNGEKHLLEICIFANFGTFICGIQTRMQLVVSFVDAVVASVNNISIFCIDM